jgi:hypothetical protein
MATSAAPMMKWARRFNLEDNQTVPQMDKLATVFGGTVILK